VWIGGGSQLADPGSPDLPRLVEAVKKRILAAEGWVPRPTCPPEDIARDWEELQVYFKENGRDPADLIIAHENFFHFVSTQDPIRAREEQHEAMSKVMSEARGRAYLERVYLFGTPDEVVESLQARVDAGVQSFMLHTMTPDPAQLEQWATHIIPHVRFPTAAG
jgi:alkanesulfonate monooxygenase SsuD/methylene tetrahydromethanopterin reductase-like flavin-dependent oxidoreductase (luciferase family)